MDLLSRLAFLGKDASEILGTGFKFDIFGKSVDLTEWVLKAGVLLSAFIVANILIKFFKPIFKIIDDHISSIDLSDEMHCSLEGVVKYTIILIFLVVAFWIVLEENPVSSQLFQLISVLILAKISVLLVTPSLREFDKQVSRVDVSKHTQVLFQKAVSYVIYGAALVSILSILGFTDILTAALAGAGVAGIAVGFAAKDVLSNIISGITIILDRPFKIGDTIEIKTILGTVDEISLRTTTIRKFDNKIVTVPNSILATSPIINYTREKIRRIDIPVGIAYDSDIEEAITAIKKAVSKIDGVVTQEGKQVAVLVDKFQEFSISLKVRIWVETKVGILTVKSKAVEEIKKALDDVGIEIPYPVRVMVNKEKKSKKQ